MIQYNRKMESETVTEINAYHYQAAFNSDGCITLRGIIKGVTGVNDKDETLIVLNQSETRAILNLLAEIKRAMPMEMPF